MEYIRIISTMARDGVVRANLTPGKAAVIAGAAITALIVAMVFFGKRR